MASMMPEVMSQVVDFNKRKMKASKSDSVRVVIPATNGNSFALGGSVAEIQIAGNQMNTFMDFQSSYLKFTINNGAGAAIKLGGGAGAYNIISKLEVLSSGFTLCSIDNYNKLIGILSDVQLSSNYKLDSGSLLAGQTEPGETADQADLIEIPAAGSRTFCLPLHALPMNTHKYWPLFARDNLRIRLTFASAANGTIGAATDAEVTVSPVELVATNIRLNENAMQALNQMVGGVYTIVTSDYRNSTSTVAAADSTFVANTAFSHMSLDRVLFGFFGTESTAGADSNGNRSFPNLQEYSFVVNGQHVPARKIQVSATNPAEPFAELANSSNALYDIHHTGSLNSGADVTGTADAALISSYLAINPAGDQNNRVGKFVAGINCEQVRQHGSEDSVYSGLKTLGAVTQIEGSCSAAAGAQLSLQAYSNFTVIYSLDTNGSNTWIMQS